MQEFTAEIGNEICTLIAEGVSLNAICESLKIKLHWVYKWLKDHEEFASEYASAREASADSLAQQIQDLADDETIDPRSRQVRIEARKWIAGKLKPRKWGDKTVLSNDPDNPIGSLAGRLDSAINGLIIDVTPKPAQIGHNSGITDCSDLV